MPKGKGTYGSKRGRPPKKKRTVKSKKKDPVMEALRKPIKIL